MTRSALMTRSRSWAWPIHRRDGRYPWNKCFSANTDSTSTGIQPARTTGLKLWEYSASDGSDDRKRGVLYVELQENRNVWEKIQGSSLDSSGRVSTTATTTTTASNSLRVEYLTKDILGYFLPAHFPESVSPGYARFASFCFTASVAGSAAMVLSTQTLLLAVGVVGSNVHQAGIMAGAFNWVMKDFVGQLGGVLFASQMGKTRAFDTDPKRWRMVAAMALDGATLLEILSPLFPSILVLPVASIANVGKNIGFLTASASRAALHQSVAITGNLGDVTAKAGSQSIMASLIGTSLGIGMSSLLSHDTYNFAMGFCVLGIIHQGCNFLAVQSVPLAYFNRQRLHILLDHYINDGKVMTPKEVAQEESFFPLASGDAGTRSWLSVGATSLEKICPTPTDLQEALSHSSLTNIDANSQYILRAMPDGHVHLMFFQTSVGDDLIRGMYHACLLRHHVLGGASSIPCASQTTSTVDNTFEALLTQIRERGWKTDTEVTTIEDSHARRLVWKE